MLRVGVLLLFLGLAFLLRYATEGMVVPIEVRYAGVAAAAIALLGLGWWLRRRNPNYGLMLQGAGIAVLYLTVFAAMRLHPLLDPKMALILLIVVTICSAILAVLQDALGLAAAAARFRRTDPHLHRQRQPCRAVLHFALLNAGIFAIAWFKAWRLLNLIGFVGTFGIGFAWGMRSYTPELFASTEPFLVLFFLMYLAIGLLFARRKLREAVAAPDGERDALLRWSARQGDYIDGTVLFGPPLVGFGLQYAVIHHIEFGAAFSALTLGLLYMLIARVLAGRAPGARCWWKPAWPSAWSSAPWPFRWAWMRAGPPPPGRWKAPASSGWACASAGRWPAPSPCCCRWGGPGLPRQPAPGRRQPAGRRAAGRADAGRGAVVQLLATARGAGGGGLRLGAQRLADPWPAADSPSST